MPKKLYVGNYRFDASEQIVYVQGNVQPEKFLIITNITDNTIIYNFADPALGYAGKFYNSTTDELDSIIGVTRPKEASGTAAFVGTRARAILN